MPEYEDYTNCDQYHKALQKLENEVRIHIKIEQQLKLHIENTQQKLIESESARLELASTSKSIIEKLKKESSDKPTHRREESSPLSSRSINSDLKIDKKLTQEISTLKMNSKKDSVKIAELMKDKKRLELEVALQKNHVDKKPDKTKENRSESANCVTDFYKKKFEEKCEQVALLEKQIRLLRTRASEHNFSYIERRRNSYTQRELTSKSPIKEEKSASNLRSISPYLSKNSNINTRSTSADKSPKPTVSQASIKTRAK